VRTTLFSIQNSLYNRNHHNLIDFPHKNIENKKREKILCWTKDRGGCRGCVCGRWRDGGPRSWWTAATAGARGSRAASAATTTPSRASTTSPFRSAITRSNEQCYEFSDSHTRTYIYTLNRISLARFDKTTNGAFSKLNWGGWLWGLSFFFFFNTIFICLFFLI